MGVSFRRCRERQDASSIQVVSVDWTLNHISYDESLFHELIKIGQAIHKPTDKGNEMVDDPVLAIETQ